MSYQPLPISWSEITAEEQRRVTTTWPVSMVNDLIRYDNGMVMPRSFTKIADKIYNFTLREDDIWIVTYPKTGTTWTQEMVWMLVNGMDTDKGNVPLTLRSPFLEMGVLLPADGETMKEMAKDAPQPLMEAVADPLTY